MNNTKKSKIILKLLNKTYPKVPIPLNYKNTFTLLISVLLSAQCTDVNVNNVTKDILFTGGGCKNTFLIELLKAEGLSFELPDEKTIDYKEALIFAFLGLFRYLGHINTLKSVTGASKNSSGGNIFIP